MPKETPSRRPTAGQAPGRPRVRRGYFECRYGQLHVHNAIPSGGGFEEGTPLLCLHPSLHSGRIFQRLLVIAGTGRSVFAPDLPGFGDSDPAPAQAGVAEHAAAISDFLDTMRLRQIDLLGQRYGALVAAELAAARPERVRRMVLVSPPLAAGATDPALPAPAADGSHLHEMWRRAAAYCGPGASPETVSRALADGLHNAGQAAAAEAAERTYSLRTRLAPLSMPLLVLRLRDDVRTNAAQPHELPARARLIELPEQGASLFETAPEAAALAMESFLR